MGFLSVYSVPIGWKERKNANVIRFLTLETFRCCYTTYISVVSRGNLRGNSVNFLFLQSAMPSVHEQASGQVHEDDADDDEEDLWEEQPP